MIKKIIRRLKRISERCYAKKYSDDIILFNADRRTRKKEVNLHWYSMCREDGLENLGDYLSTIVYNYMLERKEIDPYTKVSATKHLYGIGSIIFFGFQKATIWGSGCLLSPKSLKSKHARKLPLDIRSVRGPATKAILESGGYSCPEIYGDPAIIMPLIYMPTSHEIKKEYSVILHKSANESVENQIDIITCDYKSFIDEIVSSKKVISSSLHGIILAETYGVPAILLADSREDFSLFKYNDYYYSTGRYEYPVAKTIQEAITLEPPCIPDFTKMRQNIINAFPYDLWNN